MTAVELRDILVRLDEAARDLHRFAATVEHDPARAEAIEAELDRIATARRRYGAATLDDLLERRSAAVGELESVGEGRDPVEVARSAVVAAEAAYETVAMALTEARGAAATPFAEAVSAELKDVGMGEGELELRLTPREAGPTGRDAVAFLIRPNTGLPFGPVAETASGGELSRVALALAAVAGGETLVFDEIDAGIGGVTAHKVAGVLRRLAEQAQVLTITHLPQIASVADLHLRVEKVPGEPTETRIEVLDDDERRAELERMLGGGAFVAAITAEQA
jgi:DNA repair protein RecN (Recombination protein N)